MTKKIIPRINRMLYYFLGVGHENYFRILRHEQGNQINIQDLCPIQKALISASEMYGYLHEGGIGQVFGYEKQSLIIDSINGLVAVGDFNTAKHLAYGYARYLILFDGGCSDVDAFQKLDDTEQDHVASQLFSTFLSFNEDILSRLKSSSVTYQSFSIELDNPRFILDSLEKYITDRPNEFCVDEQDRSFKSGFSGIMRNLPNPKDDVEYKLEILHDKPHGKFELVFSHNTQIKEKDTYFGEYEHGTLKFYQVKRYQDWNNHFSTYRYEFEKLQGEKVNVTTQFYDNGNPKKQSRRFDSSCLNKVGIQKKWFDNGTLHETETYDEKGSRIKAEVYYANGQKSEETYFDDNGLKHINKWYENGAVKSYLKYIDGKTECHRFYEDGSKHDVFHYGEGNQPVYHDSWDKNGNHTLINGTGYQHSYMKDGSGWYEYHYENGHITHTRKFNQHGEEQEF